MRSACYAHGMRKCKDARYSRGPLAVGRPPVRAEIIVDGTKLALVVQPSHNHNRWVLFQFESVAE
jgi:hypothetical protein